MQKKSEDSLGGGGWAPYSHFWYASATKAWRWLFNIYYVCKRCRCRFPMHRCCRIYFRRKVANNMRKKPKCVSPI